MLLTLRRQSPTTSSGESFDADAQAVIDQWKVTTAALNATWQGAIDDLVVAAKENGYWTTADLFHVFAADVETNALINWKAPTGTAATSVSATAFTAKEGYTGDNTADYIDSGVAMNGGGVNFTRNANGTAYYLRTNAVNRIYGGDLASATTRYGDTGFVASRINGANFSPTANTTTGVRGFSRSGANDIAAYHSGAAELGASAANASVALTTAGNFICLAGNNGSFGGSQISFWWIGGTISQAIVDDMNTDVAAFLTAIAGA